MTSIVGQFQPVHWLMSLIATLFTGIILLYLASIGNAHAALKADLETVKVVQYAQTLSSNERLSKIEARTEAQWADIQARLTRMETKIDRLEAR